MPIIATIHIMQRCGFVKNKRRTFVAAADGNPVPPPSAIENGAAGEQVEEEAFHDATCMTALRLVCLPGSARNAVATAAIAANTQAERKT